MKLTNEERKKLEEEISALESELEKRYARYHKMCEEHHRNYPDPDSEVGWEIFSSTCGDYFNVHIAPLRDLIDTKIELLKHNLQV
ncbi:MAG: hypothetical protein IKH64_09110 [Prevotella sp.]|nr:hypothetical protein [Prevotella sp.]